MTNPKRKRIAKAPTKVKVPFLNDGTNSPVPTPSDETVRTPAEAALYKQAENPLGDPQKK